MKKKSLFFYFGKRLNFDNFLLYLCYKFYREILIENNQFLTINNDISLPKITDIGLKISDKEDTFITEIGFSKTETPY